MKTKTTEQLKALEALFEETPKIPKQMGQRKASKRGRQNKEDDIEYRKACMRPVDLYSVNIKGHKKQNCDFRKAEKLEVTSEVTAERRIVKIKMLKD